MIDITKYKKYFLPVGVSLIGLVVMFYVAGVLLPKQLVTLSKASSVGSVSASNSIMVGSRILAKADGEDFCKVNVFASDEESKPISGAKVTLSGSELVDPKQGVTNDEGKVIFTIKSKEAGVVKISATINGVTLKNPLSIVFSN